MKFPFFAVFTLVCGLVASKPVLADSYTVTFLPAVTRNGIGLTGANDLGQFVGNGLDGKGYLQYGYGVQTIAFPGSPSTSVLGINNAGTIVGQYQILPGGIGGFIYANGKFSTISYPGANYIAPWSINNSGEIAGFFEHSNGYDTGFTYANGVFNTINVPGARSTWVYGINDSGEIVGGYQDQTANYLYREVGGVFSTLSAPNCLYASLYGVNDNGLIAATCTTSTKNIPGYFDNSGVFVPIIIPGLAYESIVAISNQGVILGGYYDAAGGYARAFEATPLPSSVPEPGTLALVGTGLLTLGGLIRRKIMASGA